MKGDVSDRAASGVVAGSAQRCDQAPPCTSGGHGRRSGEGGPVHEGHPVKRDAWTTTRMRPFSGRTGGASVICHESGFDMRRG